MNLPIIFHTLKSELRPTKWRMFKLGFNLFFILFLSGYYMYAINQQMLKDDNPDLFTSIGRVMREQYDFISSPFLGLLKKAEGFDNKFYPDNKGYAVGYGYNPTQNSSSYNKTILDYAGVDAKTQKLIIQNAEKYRNYNSRNVPPELKDIHLTKEQLDKMAVFAQNSYEQSFFRVLNHKLDNHNITGMRKSKIVKAYTELPENKKAVLIHMAYKVGERNLDKYNTFFNNLISYLEKPSDSNKSSVANSFTYKYVLNGKTLSDTRVEKLHHDLFIRDMPNTTPVEVVYRKPKELNTKLARKELSEQEKFNRAMDEVKTQISMKSVWTILAKTADKINEVFPDKGSRHKQMMEPEYDGYFENRSS